MATLLAHIRVRPGKEVQFERIAEELYRATHEREADVRRYEYWRGAEPSTYYALESFDDLAGFVAHQTSEHHEAARPGLGEVIEDIRLEWVDPLPDRLAAWRRRRPRPPRLTRRSWSAAATSASPAR